jgi:hypothetical protein
VADLRAALPALVLVGALAGCSSDSNGDEQQSADVLLSRSDVAPLEPSSVSSSSPQAYTGSQEWSCSDNDGLLLEKGWEVQVRDLRNTEDNWALFSAVLDDPDGDAAGELPAIRAQVEKCRTEEDAGLEDVDLGVEDSYAYRSVSADGQVDTVRAYAVVDEHRLVQLTLLGLNDQDAPDQIRELLRKAVAKAS